MTAAARHADLLGVMADHLEQGGQLAGVERIATLDELTAALRAGRMTLTGTHPGIHLRLYRDDPDLAIIAANSDELHHHFWRRAGNDDANGEGRHRWLRLTPPLLQGPVVLEYRALDLVTP